MTPSTLPSPTSPDQRQRFGKDIAFGMRQTIACWLTDPIIDVQVSEKIQHYFEPPKPGHDAESKKGFGFAGELIGDSSAFLIFLGLRKLLPAPFRRLKSAARSAGDGLYDWMGRKQLESWRRKQGLDTQSADYKQALERWKDSQAETFSKASVISALSIPTNVTAQKLLNNKSKWWVITLGKLVGAVSTMSVMLGLETLAPKSMAQLDKELDERYFSPLIRQTQRLMGAAETGEDANHAEKITARRANAQPALAAR